MAQFAVGLVLGSLVGFVVGLVATALVGGAR